MEQEHIPLPAPDRTGATPLETLLARRRSERDFADPPIELADLAQLLWAGLGVNRPSGERTIASAGALYPLELYVMAGAVRSLAPGVYWYDAERHAVVPIDDRDSRQELARAAVGQNWIGQAPAVLAAAAYERSTGKYGDRGVRYTCMEVGLLAHSVYLQAAALGLGTTFVGAFDDTRVADILHLPDEARPLALLPVGTPRDR